jgi:glycosyltransferase involved in cell wall biosynthesis
MKEMLYSETTPVISVIIAVYNGEKYLEQTIQSVLAQTYPQVELIVIDGGSKDRTTDILKTHSDQIHYWISEKDKGVYDAWNKGLKHANGEWITFLGADDFFWNTSVLENIIPYLALAKEKSCHYVYGNVNLLSGNGTIISSLGQPWEESKKKILHRMTVVHCASFHHQSLFAEHGPFNTQFKIAGDYEFLLREFVKGRDAYYVNQTVAGMRAGGLSANIRLRLKVAKEDVLARQLHQMPPTFSHKLQIIKAHLAVGLIKTLGVKTVENISDMLRVLKGKEKMWSKIE